MGWKDSAEWMAKHMSIMYDDATIVGDNKLHDHMSLFRDDGSIGTHTVEDHIYYVKRMLECVKRHMGTLSDKKSVWFIQRAHALGFLVGQDEVIPEEKKVRTVIDWPAPSDQTKLRSFVGFLLFFSHCVPASGRLLAPLYPLYRSEYSRPKAFQAEWQRSMAYAQAFSNVKRAIASAASLRTFDVHRPILLAADGSKTGLAVVAGHAADPGEDGQLGATTKYWPSAFYSRPCTDTEQRYSQPEREFQAIVYGVRKISPYIGRQLVILTDHKAWVQVQNTVSANSRVEKWRMKLAALPLDPGYPRLIFRAGTKQHDVDPLSRLEESHRATSDLDDQLSEEIEDPVIISMKLCRLGWQPYDDIANWLKGDMSMDWTAERQRSIARMALRYFIDLDNSRLYYRARQGAAPRMVPTLEQVQPLIGQYHGESDAMGHLSTLSTYQLMAPRYYWHRMYDDIRNYVDNCGACQKRRRAHPVGRFQMYRITPPTTMFCLVGMDTCSLPRSYQGHIGYVLMIDYTSDWLVAKALRKFEGDTIIACVRSYCYQYGWPQGIILDLASYFVQGTFATWTANQRIHLMPTSSQHAQGNGRAEKAHSVLVPLIAWRLLHN